MFSKLFALIDSVKMLSELAQLLYREYTKHLIRNAQGDIEQRQQRRNAYLDAIKQAQRERDENKVMYYSRLLATDGLPDARVQSPDSERLSRL